jgi:hypothetical protein
MQHDNHATPLEQGPAATGDGAGDACRIGYDPEASGKLRSDLLQALERGVREIVLVVRPSGTIAVHDRELIEAVGAALVERGGALLTLSGDAGDPEAFLVRELRGGKVVTGDGRPA